MADVLSWTAKPVVETAGCPLQNGFGGGRQLVQNPVDLHHASGTDAILFRRAVRDRSFRFTSLLSVVHEGVLNALPITVLFDFAMASASVSNTCVFFLLSLAGLPEVLLDAIFAFCKLNKAFIAFKMELSLCPVSDPMF